MRLARSLPNPVASLGFLHILNDGYLASLPLLLPFVREELGLGFGEIGFLGSVLSAAGVALALPSSWIARRFGGMRVLRMALVLYSGAFLVVGVSPGIVLLASAFLMASVGFGAFHPIGFALVARGGDSGGIGKKMGDFTAVGDIGRIGIAAALTFLVSALTWRGAAFAYGLAPLAMVGLSLLCCRPLPGRGRESPDAPRREAPGLRRNAAFILMTLAGALDSLASSSLFMFLPFLLVHRGMPGALLGSLSAAFFVGNMLGKLLLGRIVDRMGKFRVFAASELAMAGLLVLLSSATSMAAIAALSILLGAVTKGTVPVVNTMVAESVKSRGAYEKAFGVMSLVGGVAGIAAPLGFGLVAKELGILSVFRLSACFALAAIAPAAWQAARARRAP